MSSTCGTVLKRYLLLPFLFQLNPVVTYGATPNISLQNSHPGGVSSVAFSKNGGRLFSGGSNGKVKVWDVSSRKLIKELKPTFKVINKYMSVTSIAVSPDGKYVAGGTEVNMVEV